MRRLHVVILGITLTLLLLTACQQERPAPVDARSLDPFSPEAFCAWESGDPEAGRALFERPVLAGGPGCITCHSLAPGVSLVGPSLYGIAATAGERQPGMLPDNYIYLSIVEPASYVVSGFPANVMPDFYAERLSETEITDLVSYLMTLQPNE